MIMQRRPLADDLAPDARILDLALGGARILIRGHVADAVAAGLDGMHLDLGELGEDVRRLFELGPVELEVLARREVAVALVVAARDEGELAQLARVERPVRDRDAEHVGVELEVETVHQAQRPELVFGQLAGEPSLHLAAELGDPILHERMIVFVVVIHRYRTSRASACLPRSFRTVGPRARIRSRYSFGRRPELVQSTSIR
jgi:hypothetical protein